MTGIMPFRIALNMAGAVSAGAYTAGVLDFLVEALDAWYDARAEQFRLHGADVEAWTIPAHDVLLEALSGASAGGMCAAISSVALKEEFDHVTQTAPPRDAAVNRLYQSWVRTIDILPLLGTQDLPDAEGPVKSILDSTPIENIANTALQINPARSKQRLWMADPLGIILTLSNLRGIPYSVDKANDGSFEERIDYHADQIRFSISRSGSVSTPTTIGLNYENTADPNWDTLRTAAMATGAFPIMLASRVIRRSRTDYEHRVWEISNSEPGKTGECESEDTILPDWAATVTPAFENVYADGGITNNNPFECARQYLVDAANNADGHNPRDAIHANAAVISVAPFPGNEPFDPSYDAHKNSELASVASALLGTLVNQSRFQGEDLKLTKDEDVNSRFAIAPSDDSAPSLPSLLCGSLGAFGGFIDEKFRDRDYQLGRRNCQQFLRVHFALPEDNTIIAPGAAKRPEILDAFRQAFGQNIDGTWWYSIIPLMPALQAPVAVAPREGFKTTPDRLEAVAAAATGRLEKVLNAFVNQPGKEHKGWSILLQAIFGLGGASKIKSLILDSLTTELKKTGQV
jgi:hypothetical protein